MCVADNQHQRIVRAISISSSNNWHTLNVHLLWWSLDHVLQEGVMVGQISEELTRLWSEISREGSEWRYESKIESDWYFCWLLFVLLNASVSLKTEVERESDCVCMFFCPHVMFAAHLSSLLVFFKYYTVQ